MPVFPGFLEIIRVVRKNNQILAIFRMLYLINNTNPFPIWKTWFGFFWFGAGDRT